MSIPRPVVYPQWAIDDVVDPISGQNNVTTPPSEKQLNGWDLKEFPPRQWFNWLGRYTYLWIQWLDQQQQTQQTGLDSGLGFLALPGVPTVPIGALAEVSAVDTMVPTNILKAIAYIPPSLGSPVTMQIVGTSSLTATISTTGLVTIMGGTGPYIVVGSLQNLT